MIKKPQGYDEARTFGTGLEPGGYVLEIKGVELSESRNKYPMLIISYDIAEGESKGHYANMYRADTRADKTWRGLSYQCIEGTPGIISSFKGFVTALEKSNSNGAYNWDWNEDSLVGKKIGGEFGREEYMKTTGEIGTTVKLFNWRSVPEIRNGIKIPKDKLLSPDLRSQQTSYMPDAYKSSAPNLQPIEDDDLPF
jgi:hypothetical protein